MSGKFLTLTFVLLFFVICPHLYAQVQKTIPPGSLSTVIQEKNILIDKRIPGIFCYPENIGKKIARLPAVLLLHGFGSHKNEVGNLYEKLAYKLAKKGIASLRIDFSGWGDSREPMEGSNLLNMLTDAEASYQFLRTNRLINSKKISICGFSLGAYIAFRLAELEKDCFALIMLSPVGNPAVDFKQLLHLLSLEPSTKTEKNTYNLGWRIVSLGKSFFSSLLNNPSLDKLSQLNTPILAIAANEDFSYQYLKTISKASLKDNIIISLQNSNHIFGIKSTNDQSSIVLDFVNDWLVDKVILKKLK